MSPAEPADLILAGGVIHTVDPSRSRAEAVAVRGDRIVHVGSREEAMRMKGPQTRLVELDGRTVVPGLTDAHGHVTSLGLSLERLDLVGTSSAEAIGRMVADKARGLPAGRWIRGRGWDQNDWDDKEFPSRLALDAAAPEHPVALERIDGHATWANTIAMQLAGVSAETPDPPGGRIVRDEKGEPTGVFIDTAEELILSRIPPPTREEARAAIRASMTRCLSSGLTSVHDAGVSQMELGIYEELLVDGDFPFRIYAMLSDDGDLQEALRKGPRIGLGDHRLTVRSIKLYIDGALGSRGAALIEPYTDDSGNVGLVMMEAGRLRSFAARAGLLGFQLAVHAIGDRGNRIVLDAIEAAKVSRDARFRIEHGQIIAPEDIPRFAALGVIASMQPTHATSDMYWAGDRLGADRLGGAYAWKSILRSGARLACGSDFPVESERPILGFHAAVTRQDAKRWPEGGWRPEEKLSREEALRCFTLDAAYAAFEEDLRGSISVGKLADFTVLSRDIMAVPEEEILGTEIEMTVVGGRIAYERR